MIERIILDIVPSDPFTDQLFVTAWYSNPRVVPRVGATGEEILQLAGGNAAVVHCDNLPTDVDDDGRIATWEYLTDTIHVRSRSYLDDRGEIDFDTAYRARLEIEEILRDILLLPRNQQEVFTEYFPLLWEGRRIVYETPELSNVPYAKGAYGFPFGSIPCLGAVLKAIDDNPGLFRLRLPGGCGCGDGAVIVDYRKEDPALWVIRTWCPGCGVRREVRTRDFRRCRPCDRAIETADRSMRITGFECRNNIFDTIDELKLKREEK